MKGYPFEKVPAKKKKVLSGKRGVILPLVLLLPLTAFSDQTSYDINLHVVKLDVKGLSGLLYFQKEATTRSLVSRTGAKFYSIVDQKQKQDTFSIGHTLELNEKLKNEKLKLIFKKYIKTLCEDCQGIDLDKFDLNLMTKKIRKGGLYLRFAQHSDYGQMWNPLTEKFQFHREVKCGNPLKLAYNKSFFTESPYHITFAHQLNHWLERAQRRDYFECGYSLEKVDNKYYQDFLLGTYCRTSIIEIKIETERGVFPGLMFFDFHFNEALIIEVLPSQEQQPVKPRAKTRVSSTRPSTFGELVSEEELRKRQPAQVGLQICKEADKTGNESTDHASFLLYYIYNLQ